MKFIKLIPFLFFLTTCKTLVPQIKLPLLSGLKPVKVLVPLIETKSCISSVIVFQEDGGMIFEDEKQVDWEVCKKADLIGIEKNSFDKDLQWNLDYIADRWQLRK